MSAAMRGFTTPVDRLQRRIMKNVLPIVALSAGEWWPSAPEKRGKKTLSPDRYATDWVRRQIGESEAAGLRPSWGISACRQPAAPEKNPSLR